MAGFIAGPVYAEPAKTITTVDMASNQFFKSVFLGPLRIIRRTRKVIPKVNNPSAIAPVCKSTFKDGPITMCLYCLGITSMIANAPKAAPAACQGAFKKWFIYLCFDVYALTSIKIDTISRENKPELL